MPSPYYAFYSAYKLLVASMIDTIDWLTQHSFPKPFFLPASIVGLNLTTSPAAIGDQMHSSGQIEKGGNM